MGLRASGAHKNVPALGAGSAAASRRPDDGDASAVPSYKCPTTERRNMVDITIFELHLDEPNLTANAPFSGSGGKDVGASDEPLPEESSSKGKLVGALVGLVFLAAVAFVAKRKGGGGASEDGEQLELADATA
jgi:hypothetical protein